ncbi:MAG: transglutaminaseTgpA domain-containing protein, partial [Janthinobacterium lividum]
MGLTTLTVLPLTSDRAFVPVTWLGTALLCTLGIVLRRRGAGPSLTFATQLLGLAVGSLVLAYLVSGDPDLVTRYPRLWARGVLQMQTQSSPMSTDPGVLLIFVTTVCLVSTLADLVVSGLERPAWVVAPLATVFAVPALGLGSDSGVLSFACLALGYLAVLVADGLNTASAWNRGLSADSSRGASFRTGPTGTRTGSGAGPAVWRAAGLLAGPAVVLALVLAVLLPTVSIPGLGLGGGFGGNGPLQLTDPSLDLKRNLNEPADRVVFRYTTDRPGGVYLRMAALPQFSAAGFGNTQIRLNAGSTLSDPPGYSGGALPVRTTKITSVDFSSQYLPAPYAARSFTAGGDWSFNSESLTVVNSDNKADVLTNLSYEVRSWDIAPSAAELSRSAAGSPSDVDVTGKVPADLPQVLVDLSRRVTRGADTPYAKAVAIQAFLRDSNNFTYDTTQRPGNGYQALVNFLTDDKRGYCEQFASSMAMMARVNGIPARVAVGFLPGSETGDTYNVSARDMHAWPELYFASYGWVRFEPTPGVQTGSPPPWTIPSTATATPSESASASSAPSSAAPTESTAPRTAPQDTPTQTTTTTTSLSWGTVGLVAGGVVLLLLLAAPATLRVRRRRSRLDGEGPTDEQVEAAWAELRDTVLDFGGTWP